MEEITGLIEKRDKEDTKSVKSPAISQRHIALCFTKKL
jgi:hypothetical protein